MTRHIQPSYKSYSCFYSGKNGQQHQTHFFLGKPLSGFGFPRCAIPRVFFVPNVQAIHRDTEFLTVNLKQGNGLFVPPEEYCIDRLAGNKGLRAIICNMAVENAIQSVNQHSSRQGRKNDNMFHSRRQTTNNRTKEYLRKRLRNGKNLGDGIKELFSKVSRDVFNLKQSADATLKKIGEGIHNVISLDSVANDVVYTVGDELANLERSGDSFKLDEVVGKVISVVATNVLNNVTKNVAQRRSDADDTETKIYDTIEQLMPIVGDVLIENVNKGLQNLPITPNDAGFDEAFQQIIPSIALDIMKNVNNALDLNSPDGNKLQINDIFRKLLPVVALDVMSIVQTEMKRVTNQGTVQHDETEIDILTNEKHDLDYVDYYNTDIADSDTNEFLANNEASDDEEEESSDNEMLTPEEEELLKLFGDIYHSDESNRNEGHTNEIVLVTANNNLDDKFTVEEDIADDNDDLLSRLIIAEQDTKRITKNSGDKVQVLGKVIFVTFLFIK